MKMKRKSQDLSITQRISTNNNLFLIVIFLRFNQETRMQREKEKTLLSGIIRTNKWKCMFELSGKQQI